MAIDVGWVQGTVTDMQDELIRVALKAGWRSADGADLSNGLLRVSEAVDALGIEDTEELVKAITPDAGAMEFLRDVNEYVLAKGGDSQVYAVPSDVAFVLLLRSRGEGMNLIHGEYAFKHDSLNHAVDAALQKQRMNT